MKKLKPGIVIQEVNLFSNAVNKAIDWSEKHSPLDTLILVVNYLDYGSFSIDYTNIDRISASWNGTNPFLKRLFLLPFNPQSKAKITNRRMAIYAWGKNSADIHSLNSYSEIHKLILDNL